LNVETAESEKEVINHIYERQSLKTDLYFMR